MVINQLTQGQIISQLSNEQKLKNNYSKNTFLKTNYLIWVISNHTKEKFSPITKRASKEHSLIILPTPNDIYSQDIIGYDDVLLQFNWYKEPIFYLVNIKLKDKKVIPTHMASFKPNLKNIYIIKQKELFIPQQDNEFCERLENILFI